MTDTPGPPREVQEDAAARERMTATPEEMANDIMHEACLPQSLIDKGVHQAMYEAIRDRIREAADAAREEGKAEGAADEKERNLFIVNGLVDQLNNNTVPLGSQDALSVLSYAGLCIAAEEEPAAREGGESDG